MNLAFEVAPYFELENDQAREISASIADVLANWRDEAGAFGLDNAACQRIKTAFEHEDLEIAKAA